MTRYEAITKITSQLTDEVLITSCGMISREVYKARDRARNLYLMSAMGSELAVGLGLAYSRPDLHVVVLSGNGSAMMSYNTVLLYDDLKLKNIDWIILDNKAYATTGGQPTMYMPATSGHVIKVSNEKGDAPRIPLSPKDITRRFRDAIHK